MRDMKTVIPFSFWLLNSEFRTNSKKITLGRKDFSVSFELVVKTGY